MVLVQDDDDVFGLVVWPLIDQILMEEDLAKHSQVPWYQPLDPNHFSLSTLRLTPIGRFFTHNMVCYSFESAVNF